MAGIGCLWRDSGDGFWFGVGREYLSPCHGSLGDPIGYPGGLDIGFMQRLVDSYRASGRFM
jgi:hypothetical protein